MLMIIIITILLFYYIIKYINKQTYKNIKNNSKNNIKNYNENINNYKEYYKPKRYITTINELKFYNILLEISKELHLILFSQVSLYNIVSMKDNLDYSTRTKYFNKIASKSIDFVLVDKNN